MEQSKKYPLFLGYIYGLYLLCGYASSSLVYAESNDVYRNGPFIFNLAENGLKQIGSLRLPEEEVTLEEYRSFLFSSQRSNPLVIIFTSIECKQEEEEEVVVESEESDEFKLKQQEENRVKNESNVVLNMQEIAVDPTYTSSKLEFVHIIKEKFPQALDYHHIEKTPSLLYIPPRSSRTFQRFAQVGDNALYLSFKPKKLKSEVTSLLAKQLTHLQRQSSVDRTANAPNGPGLDDPPVLLVCFILFGLISVLLGPPLWTNRTKILSIVQARSSWFMFCTFIMYVALSGTFHTIIHEAPLFHASPQHGVYLFHPTGRMQFGLEGLLCGTACFVISLGAFVIIEVMPYIKTAKAKEDCYFTCLLVIGITYCLMYFIFANKFPWLYK